MKTAIERVREINKASIQTMSGRPELFIGLLTEDPGHWLGYGITTAEELDAYLAQEAARGETDEPPLPERTSMLHWFPSVQAAGLPVPRTVIVPFDPATMWPGCDNQPMPDVPWERFEAAAESIGFPCFLRTDMTSAKHNGPKTYKAMASGQGLRDQLFATFYDAACKDQITSAFVFREWLDLDARFSAFGWTGPEGVSVPGHPIAREWRFFADSHAVHCAHFYWPETAIEGQDPSVENWREQLATLGAALPLGTYHELCDLAVKAVRAIGEPPNARWSVDFAQGAPASCGSAQDRAGKWWLIDMAVAEKSWHPECKHRETRLS